MIEQSWAQFHGSAYCKHGIGAYEGREFRLAARVLNWLAVNFGYSTLLGILG